MRLFVAFAVAAVAALGVVAAVGVQPNEWRDRFDRWETARRENQLDALNGVIESIDNSFDPSAPRDGGAAVAAGAAVLWTLSHSQVGRIGDVAVAQNVVVLGSQYLSLQQVTVVALDSGAILSKATPRDSAGQPYFSYSVEISDDGQSLSVCGDPINEGGPASTILTWTGKIDVSAKPAWTWQLNGSSFWNTRGRNARGFRMSQDGGILAYSFLNKTQDDDERRGGFTWMSVSNGRMLGHRELQNNSMGEMWLDERGTRIVNREYFLDGRYRFFMNTFSSPSGAVIARAEGGSPFSRVSPDARYSMATTQWATSIVQLSNTETGAPLWSFVDESPDHHLAEMVVGRKYAIGIWWCEGKSSSRGYLVRVFSVIPSGAEAVPTYTFLIDAPLPPKDNTPAHAVVSKDAATRDLAIAISGTGIYYVSLDGSAAPRAVLVYTYVDTCGLGIRSMTRGATRGLVIIAVLSQRLSQSSCALLAAVTSISV